MPGRNRVSFRILHPDPFDLPPGPNLRLRVDFSSKPQALRFQAFLRNNPAVRQLHYQKDLFFSVLWTLSLNGKFSFPESMKGFSRELSSQMEGGIRGFLHKGNWVLPGRRGKKIRWARKTQVMGILNVTPDSFSDGGRYLDPQLALDQALQMQEEGADWIDVGGESTRPGAKGISAAEEKKRILPVLKACSGVLRVPLSVDTSKAEVARAAVGEGVQMVNDVGALRLDPKMGRTLAQLKVSVILMHMRGKPRTMQRNPVYRDLMGELLSFFRERLDFAVQCGISEDRLLIDPGFGFGKTPAHNIEMTRRLWELKLLGRPLVMGPSRKSTLGFLLGGAPPEERVEATGAAVASSILKGADFVRVHDVKAMARVVKIADAIRYNRGLSKS